MHLLLQAEAHEAATLEDVVAAEPDFARYVGTNLSRAEQMFLF